METRKVLRIRDLLGTRSVAVMFCVDRCYSFPDGSKNRGNSTEEMSSVLPKWFLNNSYFRISWGWVKTALT